MKPFKSRKVRVSPPSLAANLLLGYLIKIFLLGILSMIGVGMGWWMGNKFTGNSIISKNQDNQLEQISTKEWQKRTLLRRRRLELGIDYQFYQSLIRELMRQRYPRLTEEELSLDLADANWPKERYSLEMEVLSKLSRIPKTYRQLMGKDNQPSKLDLAKRVNVLRLSGNSLYDLADTHFFYIFPEQKNRDFEDETIYKVWLAIAAEELDILLSGKNYQRISFNQFGSRQLDDHLKPGVGNAYAVFLRGENNRFLDVKLNSNGKTLLSVYSPTGKQNILKKSPQGKWAGILSETGYYEFVVLSNDQKPINYELQLVYSSLNKGR